MDTRVQKANCLLVFLSMIIVKKCIVKPYQSWHYPYHSWRCVLQLINLHFHPRPIYLSRHGQSEYNKLEKIGGDSGLSEAGEQYAVALAKYAEDHILQDKIEGVASNPKHARLMTSSLRRTQLTARHIKHEVLDDGWVVMRPKVFRNLDEIYAGVTTLNLSTSTGTCTFI